MSPLVIRRDRRAILIWLGACAAMVALMVLIGGYTRLSGSGLSITEWKPVYGALPPLNEAQWQSEFNAYQASPQFRDVNSGMTLEEFKGIFWPEFVHRLFGRAVGAIFLLQLLVFAARRSFSARFGWRLAIIFALGGLQGLIGWLMVYSGLINNPQVSPIRLALHLSTALLILALILWAIMDVIYPAGLTRIKGRPARWYMIWFMLLCLQIILGAFMSGFHAGLVYNTWPSMNGRFLPEELFSDPVTLIQFLHRNMACIVAFGFLFWWYSCRIYVKKASLGKVCAGVTAIIAIQFALGVLTLLHQAPLPLALAHQTVALALFVAGVLVLHRVRRGTTPQKVVGAGSKPRVMNPRAASSTGTE